jgi:hypothetical protein
MMGRRTRPVADGVGVVVSTKVSAATAAGLQSKAQSLGQTVSELLREYCDAVAAGQRWQLCDEDDELIGYAFRLED